MSTLRQKRLGRELRHIRESAGLKPEYVAEQLHWSRPKLNRIENARVGVTPDDVEVILDLYGVNSPEREVLLQLARDARKRGWWTNFGDIFDGMFVGLEDQASSIRSWQTQLVPGLLQTEAYARAVISAPGDDPPARVEDRVRARLARQPLLNRSGNPPVFHAVLAEAVLRQQIGGPEVMRAQVSELWVRAQRPNITIQVLPFAAGAHVGLGGPFVRLGFEDPADPDVVYVEGQHGDVYLESADAHARLRLTWERLTRAALAPEESVRFLVDLSKE